jgi:hypothetical protein
MPLLGCFAHPARTLRMHTAAEIGTQGSVQKVQCAEDPRTPFFSSTSRNCPFPYMPMRNKVGDLRSNLRLNFLLPVVGAEERHEEQGNRRCNMSSIDCFTSCRRAPEC